MTISLDRPAAEVEPALRLRGLPAIGQAPGTLGSGVRAYPSPSATARQSTAAWLATLPGRPSAWTVLLPPSLRPRTTVVAVDYAEREQVLAELGPAAARVVAGQLAGAVRAALPASTNLVTTVDGRVLAPIGARRRSTVARALRRMVEEIRCTGVRVDGRSLAITPAVGWSAAPTLGPRSVPELPWQALEAAHQACGRLDGVPRRWVPTPEVGEGRLANRTRRQIGLTVGLALLWPLAVVGLSALLGIQPADWSFRVVVGGLVLTAAMIWLETVLALPRATPPPLAPDERPPMTAIIAADLVNEAATIRETLEAFLRADYDRLEVVLAYNTPEPLPVEVELADLAAAHPRLTVVRVPFSTSKAQNINAGLHLATGEIIGIFDADHHPAPDAFDRAAAWIAGGADVVQGRCVIRNGEESPVSAMVAREFDVLYGVSHLGRSRLHGFAVFGGSNGWWRADLLRRLRLRRDMLTEDIDVSVRALLGRANLVYDPDIVSTELAPTTVASWWRQRTRWAQGWLQVSLRHLLRCLRAPQLSRRQRLGTLALLGWRELAPWLTLAILPLLVWSAWFDSTPGVPLNVPSMLLALAFTSAAGPLQTWVAYRTTPAAHRAPARRYALYAMLSLLWYTELKNVVARVAQVKEAVGERRWVTTPRTARAAAPEAAAGASA
ncbi:MAG TPA: glycosyltransferase family 2 protein [Geodermatophilus sp.]|nr:glycosyltransferase family 2 protein [Geodermatophilus sp.]